MPAPIACVHRGHSASSAAKATTAVSLIAGACCTVASAGDLEPFLNDGEIEFPTVLPGRDSQRNRCLAARER